MLQLPPLREKISLGTRLDSTSCFSLRCGNDFPTMECGRFLVLYITSSATGANPGLGWDSGAALALYGWYTMLVYVMSIPGGILADKFIGQKKSVLYGGLVLVAGHGILAIEADVGLLPRSYPYRAGCGWP